MEKSKYARREVDLAKSYLEVNPDDIEQRDRLAWWSAYLKDFETAEKYAVSQKTKDYINERRTTI